MCTPLKLVYTGAEGTFRKFLGSFTKNGYLKTVQRGDPLCLQGVKSLSKGGVSPRLPKSVPVVNNFLNPIRFMEEFGMVFLNLIKFEFITRVYTVRSVFIATNLILDYCLYFAHLRSEYTLNDVSTLGRTLCGKPLIQYISVCSKNHIKF